MMFRAVQRFGMVGSRRAMSATSKPADIQALRSDLDGAYQAFATDMAKFAKGNMTAAARARKALLSMKNSAHQLRGAIQSEKEVKAKAKKMTQ